MSPYSILRIRAVDFREVSYEAATEKAGTGCKWSGSAVYMSCFPKGLFFFPGL